MKLKRILLSRVCASVLAVGGAIIASQPVAAHAQLVVWSTTNFLSDPVGSYGAFHDFAGGQNVSTSIVSPGADGASSQAWEISFNPASPINFQTTGLPYPAFGNTNFFLANYTLSFDLQVTGNDVSPSGGIQITIFANQSSASEWAVFGPNIGLANTVTNVFTAGTGYNHYSFPLSSFSANNGGISISTATNLSMGFGFVDYGTIPAAATETFDIANLQITMKTNPPAPPHPTVNVVAAKPGLRVFQQTSAATYNQEGFATQNPNQSWLGLATPSKPVSYAITFADFDTVANYTMNVQFCPGGDPSSPYSVYLGANNLLWTITSQGGVSGFTTGVNFKTNSASNVNGSETNVVLATLQTACLNGRGTWTLTFTSDTDGMVTTPDGLKQSFTLEPEAAAQFANPLTIFFGTSAGATGGFGQFTDLSSIAITNVADGDEFDDFTQDDTFNTTLWNTGYSVDAGSVIQVSSNTPSLWVNWTLPDDGYGLATKASLNEDTNQWFSPNYYGSGVSATNTTPRLMGTGLKWTLVPNACLPTVDGTVGGTPATSGFFRLSSPPPTL